MSVKIEDMADVLASGFEKRKLGTMSDIATPYQDYVACRRLIGSPGSKDGVKMHGGGGKNFQFPAIYKGDGNFRHVAPFSVDDTDQVDGVVTGSLEWKGWETSCTHAVEQLRVNERSGGIPQIYSFVKSKEYQMWIGAYNGMEADFWDGPTDSTDDLVPYGLLKYWLTYHASSGFYGGNHTNWSNGPAGIDCGDSNYSKWKHYTFNYSKFSETDGFAETDLAFRKTNFKGIPRKPIADSARGKEHRWGLYTTTDTVIEYEAEVRASNSDLLKRNDLGSYAEATVIRGVPFEAVPYLDEEHETSDPVIGLDWNDLTIASPGASDWEEIMPYFLKKGIQHRVFVMFVNWQAQYVMQNRRRYFLGAKSDPMSD